MLLQRDKFGRLMLTLADGSVHIDVRPVRLFPFSDRERWVSLVGADRRERLLIEAVGELPPEMQELLREELTQREFMPVITRIEHVSSDVEPCEWRVQTDRGRVSFVLKSEDDIRRLGPHRALIVDALGMRYLVPDVRQLDRYSRRVMEEYA